MSLANARTIGLNIASSLATRFVISNYAGLPKNQALILNGVDMAVCAVTSYFFEKIKKEASDSETLFSLFASRVISVVSAILITSQTFGDVPLRTALALNGIACGVGIILRLVELSICGNVELFLFV